MKSFLFLIAMLAAPQTFAEPLPADSAGKMAEMVFVRVHAAATFKDLESASVLNEVHQADMQRYIKSHHLEEVALPELEWKFESPVITIRQGGKTLKVDFSKMPASKQLVINGQTLTIQPNATFEQVTDQIARARGLRHASQNLLNLLEPSAFADDDEGMGVMGAYAYYTGLDQAYACLAGESVTISACKLRLNSSMILTDLSGQHEELLDFQCEGGKFKSATEQTGGKYHIQIDAGYDDKGELTLLTTKQDGETTCRYQLKDGKMVGMDRLSSGRYCDGRAEGDSSVERHKFHKGDEPRFVGVSSAPIRRLKDCCEVAGCPKTVMEEAAKNRARQLPGTSGSSTNK